MQSCTYCGTLFGDEYKLKRHQQTAKYCLELQHQKSSDLTCKQCRREFNRRDNLLRHQKKCIAENGSLEGKLVQLEHRIEELMTQLGPKDTTASNIKVLTDDDIRQHLDDLTIDFIFAGGRGYADFAGKYPFKNRLICTDKSRKKLRYKNEDGRIVNDTGGVKLIQRFFQIIAPRNEELIAAKYKALHEQVEIIANTGTTKDSNIVELLTKATRLQSLLAESKAAAEGADNALTREFINHLMRKL